MVRGLTGLARKSVMALCGCDELGEVTHRIVVKGHSLLR